MLHHLAPLQALTLKSSGVLNCLDLARKGPPPLSFESLTHLPQAAAGREENGFLSETPFLAFSLYGMASSFSRNHIDPEGCASVIKVESGAKLWAVQCGVMKNAPEEHKNWAEANWDVAFLQAGDTM